MLSIFSNLAKTAVAVAVAPVSLVADILTLPASAYDPYRGPFDRTAKTLRQASDALDAAVKLEGVDRG